MQQPSMEYMQGVTDALAEQRNSVGNQFAQHVGQSREIILKLQAEIAELKATIVELTPKEEDETPNADTPVAA